MLYFVTYLRISCHGYVLVSCIEGFMEFIDLGIQPTC